MTPGWDAHCSSCTRHHLCCLPGCTGHAAMTSGMDEWSDASSVKRESASPYPNPNRLLLYGTASVLAASVVLLWRFCSGHGTKTPRRPWRPRPSAAITPNDGYWLRSGLYLPASNCASLPAAAAGSRSPQGGLRRLWLRTRLVEWILHEGSHAAEARLLLSDRWRT